MPNETFDVEIPAGIQYGETVTVANLGMPRLGGGGARGRFVARVIVDVPKNLSREAREALEAFAELAEDDSVDTRKKRTMGDRIRDAIDDILD